MTDRSAATFHRLMKWNVIFYVTATVAAVTSIGVPRDAPSAFYLVVCSLVASGFITLVNMTYLWSVLNDRDRLASLFESFDRLRDPSVKPQAFPKDHGEEKT